MMNLSKSFRTMFWLVCCVYSQSILIAQTQTQTSVDAALRYIEQHYTDWGLTDADIRDMAVQYQYQSSNNGATHIFFVQRNAGIELYNGILNVNVNAKGKVFHVGKRFEPDMKNRCNASIAAISAEQAITFAKQEVGQSAAPLRIKEQPNEHTYIFEAATGSTDDIRVTLNYVATDKETPIKLAWNVQFHPRQAQHLWSIQVDALSGSIIKKQDLMTHCQFHKDTYQHEDNCVEANHNLITKNDDTQQFTPTSVTAQYRVFPLPIESPAHGDYTLLTDPADPTASPYGWHDTNGAIGAEYTITRGNNAHAYLDIANSNAPNPAYPEPNGGAALIFDYPFDDVNAEPTNYGNAAVTNLFYMCNAMHDFAYNYGMDGPAGAFQQNNYGTGGTGNDPVKAEAQDGSGTNNANFATPNDGQSGVMQMYLWTREAASGSRVFNVTAPAQVAGSYESSRADAQGWGGAITTTPVSGAVAIADDGSASPTRACFPLINDVQGKIVLIDRGECEFGCKSLNAQNAGAIAVIICNHLDELLNMGSGICGNDVTIPVVQLKKSDCQIIRTQVDNGLMVALQEPAVQEGPDNLDGDFDNGIIAHEYAHGISNRLTGGPQNSNCLGNAEQMGEGWSDFIGLVTTVNSDDVSQRRRGVGTYVLREQNQGTGIRRYPYATDMALNPLVYDNVAENTEVHAVGEIWTAMLWDLYWAMVDKYGWSADLLNGNAGNNKAIQLVMDGMKLQPCTPGFEDGRDAILAADMEFNNGADQCLIWNVFARRGLGYYASQGSSNSALDGVSSFETYPFCSNELKVTKTVTPTIMAGDQIIVTIKLINYKENPVSNVVIRDYIPVGTTYVAGSANNGGTSAGSEVNFTVNNLNVGDSITLSYKLNTPDNVLSTRIFYDNLENGDFNWEVLSNRGSDTWSVGTSPTAPSPNTIWQVPITLNTNDQILDMINEVTIAGTQPVLRFAHKYNVGLKNDGGFVQVSTNGGNTWFDLGSKMFRKGYDGIISYSSVPLPNQYVFTGNSSNYQTTYADLSAYIGQDAIFRYRFVSDSLIEAPTGGGWFIDDFEVIDMKNYLSEVCVTTEQGDNICKIPTGRGTVVQPGSVLNTHEINASSFAVSISPNPAHDILNIGISSERAKPYDISITALDGKVLENIALQSQSNYINKTINIAHLPTGMYVVKVKSDNEVVVTKVVKR
ncbi:MAG: M36 family metallopeptidase [Saprospiraceae bacterium]|nr:M36 family metallopeptidase [Saprospiraceae bacterium]MBP7679430.1 M36 family metallopeptidase [Saprospiraceae bacterium]